MINIKQSLLVFLFLSFQFLNAQNTQLEKRVSNVKEFINALDDNTTIIITADTLDFTSKNLEKIMGKKPYINYFEPAKTYFIYYGLTIHGFKNLTIQGDNTQIVSENPGDNILTFEDCENILLKNVALYHIDSYDCGGKVLCLLHSNTIKIDSVELNGSGACGAYLVNTDNAWFTNTVIYNNSENAISVFNAKNIHFNTCTIYDNEIGYYPLINSVHSTTQLRNSTINNNQAGTLYYETDNDYYYQSMTTFINCSFEDNDFDIEQEIIENIDTINTEIYSQDYEEGDEYYISPSEDKHLSIITDFINIINETNPEADQLLSFFPRHQPFIFENNEATHETVFNHYFKNTPYKHYTEIRGLEIIEDSLIKVFLNAYIMSDVSLETINTNYEWNIVFDKNDRFSSITANTPTLIKKHNLNLPKDPLTEDPYFYNYYAINKAIAYNNFELKFSGNVQEVTPYSFMEIVTYELQNFFSSYEPFDKERWKEVTKQDQQNFNIYLHQLKQYTWNELYKNLLEVDKQKTIIHQANLLSCFEIMWTANTYQYGGDIEIEPLTTSKPKIRFPKIPIFRDIDISKSLSYIHRDNINIYLTLTTTHDYKTSFSQKSKAFLDRHNFEKIKENMSKKDLKKFNKYEKEYLETIEQLDQFLQKYLTK